VRYLAALAAVAIALLGLAILFAIRRSLMRHLTLAVALAAAALSLGACASVGGAGGAETTTQLLQNLRHCERTYIGGLGGLAPPNASVAISCPAEPYETKPAAGGGAGGGAGATGDVPDR
jgi:hypothetical protein